MGTARLDAIRTRFENASNARVRHAFSKTQIREFDKISRHAPFDEHHSTIVETTQSIAPRGEARDAQLHRP
jgi:hypothetical protein